MDQALVQGNCSSTVGHTTSANASRAVEAIREALGDGLAQIYERFGDAAVSPSSDELNKLLSADNLKGLTGSIETLRLCKEEGGQWVIDANGKALQAVLNRIKTKGGQSGKELADYFGSAPYGWTLDAVKFLVAALQVGSHLKATHSAQSYVGTSRPEVRPLFTNNTTSELRFWSAQARSRPAVLEA